MAFLESAQRGRIAGLLLCLGAIWAPAALAAPSEYQVKAVFLFNFTQFVAWPSQTFATPDAPFVVGVLGDDPFGPELDASLHGESVEHHPLLLKHYQRAEQATDCQLLFIGRLGAEQWSQTLAALKGHAVLTVSDADRSGPQGVMIGLLTENNHIRLRIDLAAAKAANLTISSKLLRAAELVGADSGT